MWNMRLFRKSVMENRIWLMSDMNDGCFTRKPVDIYVRISLNYFWNAKCFKVLEKVKSHTCMFSNIFRKSCSLGDNMQNVLVSDRPQMTINMANDFCTLDKWGFTHTRTEYLIRFVFHDNNVYANVSQCYVIVHCLFCHCWARVCVSCLAHCWQRSVLTLWKRNSWAVYLSRIVVSRSWRH
jgi:hypothetical protein